MIIPLSDKLLKELHDLSCTELIVPESQFLFIRPFILMPRQDDLLQVHGLDAVFQHWPIYFLQHPTINFHNMIWTYADDIGVKCGMMNLAKGHAIVHNRLTQFKTIWDDMGSIQQFRVPQVTKCTLFLIG